jgi:bacterioferritin
MSSFLTDITTLRERARSKMDEGPITAADQIALRITQLQGEPNFSPIGIEKRSHAEYVEGDGLVDMIKEDLVAERVAIESYSEIVQWLGDKDPTTRRMMEDILAVEEEHADDLLTLLADLESRGGV